MILFEYDEPWKDKKVPNPRYRKVPYARKMIKVGSLPEDEQVKHRPSDFEIKKMEKTVDPKINYNKEIEKQMELNGGIEYRRDFYILVPNSFDRIIDYAKSVRTIPAIIMGSEIIKYHKDEYVIKVKNLPVDAVVAYFDNDKKEFESLKGKTAKEKNSFMNQNYDVYIYGVNLSDYIHHEGVIVVNDSVSELDENKNRKGTMMIKENKNTNPTRDDTKRYPTKEPRQIPKKEVEETVYHRPIDTIFQATERWFD